MRKLLIVIYLSTSCLLCKAQGINFSQDQSLQLLLVKAKEENKNIFIDFHATWCAPCKWMADSIFSQTNIGEQINQSFLNYQVQADQTAKDNPLIKSRYAEAKQLIVKYSVKGLPTFLILSPDGNLLRRMEGAFPDAQSFLAWTAKATDPKERYFALLEQYYGGKRDKPFLRQLMTMAEKERDQVVVDDLKQEISKEQ